MEAGKVSLLRRDRLWNANAKPDFAAPSLEECIAGTGPMLDDVQQALFDEARERREANITRDIATLDELQAFYAEDQRYPGWAEVQWSKPAGAALDAVTEQLKALKLTIRNVPVGAAPADGKCIFTGEPAVERIYVARAY
jgi:prolyl-tRNA synthetase